MLTSLHARAHRALGHVQQHHPIVWWLHVVKVIECDCGRRWVR